MMSSHVHLIASARNENLSGILRDFKKFTSKRIISAIEKNASESRRAGYLISSDLRPQRIATTGAINSGDRIVSQWNFTRRH